MSFIKLDSPMFVGVDETRLGIKGSTVISAAYTQNPSLVDVISDSSLLKAKDYLRFAEKNDCDLELPRYNEMRTNGLKSYNWMRINKGRFKNVQDIQHTYIAYLVNSLRFQPDMTFLYIDAFENNLEKSKFLIHEILNLNGYSIPKKNIFISPMGDKQIPIVNYADLIAFEIGLFFQKNYFTGVEIDFPDSFNNVPIEQRRLEGLPEEYRDDLERVLKRW